MKRLSADELQVLSAAMKDVRDLCLEIGTKCSEMVSRINAVESAVNTEFKSKHNNIRKRIARLKLLIMELDKFVHIRRDINIYSDSGLRKECEDTYVYIEQHCKGKNHI